jgi:4-amino-4-deoxy-L-arabinose transferase-like glycosyltransferase
MFLQRKALLVYVLLLLTAFSFRFYLANFLPNNEPNDGKVYAQIARNILEQRVYSHATEPPYEPSLIRLPGYPLFLASIYSVGGHFNNRAVRVVQAVTDTLACGVVGFIAYIWEADPKRKRLAGSFALALAALCPFTAIYVATILTETPTIFLAVTMLLSASFAFQAKSWRRSVVLWLTTGVIGSLAVLFRPDSGLFVASIGLTHLQTSRAWFGARNASRCSAGRRFGSGVRSRFQSRLSALDDSQLQSLSRISTPRTSARGNAWRVCAAWLSEVGAHLD